MASTGWTWAEAGRLTVPRYLALAAYWRRHPPLHLLAASYLGYTPRDTVGADFATFFAAMTGGESPP